MVDIESLEMTYFINADPVPYKLKDGRSILIYPITVRDYPRYQWAIETFTIDKNSINDVRIIQMSYLKFLIEEVMQKDKTEETQSKFWWIMHLCLHFDYVYCQDGKIFVCDENGTITYIITSKDFENIKTIILNQNDIEYDDRYINPEVKELMQEYYKIKYSDVHSPSFEKKKGFVTSKTGIRFSELSDMTYREFQLVYKSCIDSEIYMATKVTEASYKYEVKNPTKHPLFEKDKDPYAELFSNTNTLSGKGISGAEQLNMMNMQ